MPTSQNIHFSKKHYWLFVLWAGAVLLCIGFMVSELQKNRNFDTSIMALLPDSHHSEGEDLAQQKFMDAADDRLVFLVAATSKADSLSAAQAFSQRLAESQQFASVNGEINNPLDNEWQRFFYPWRYQLLTYDSAQRLQQHDSSLITDSLTKLFSPLASVIAPTLTDDPLQLYMQWQTSTLPRTGFDLQNNWLTLQREDLNYRLITATLLRDPYDMPYQQAVMNTLQNAESQLPPNTRVLMSGLIIHATHGAQQAKQEISTIGAGSALGILLLLFACFRRLSRVLLAFLPLLIGCLIALSLSLLIFDHLHLITLAFGASLIGVAIDYSLHYLCAAEETSQSATGGISEKPDQPSPLRRILPGLTLGLLSSVLAYAAQAAAPFPGLQQMAVFSVLGLIGAWMTVICWLPLLSQFAQGKIPLRKVAPHNTPEPERGFQGWLLRQLSQWRDRWPRIESRNSVLCLAIVAAVLIVIVSNIQGTDDLRLLQTSPPALLQEDASVQELLSGPNPSQYFIVQADSEQALLRAEEAFTPSLNRAIQENYIHGYQATSQFVPSNQRQASNRELYADQVFSDSGLLTQWADKGQLAPVADQARRTFAQSTRTPLSLQSWQQSSASELIRHLWLGPHQNRYYSVITLTAIQGPEAIKQLRALADNNPQVLFSDRVHSISSMLENYRHQLIQWLLLAYGLVTLMLAVRYRFNTLRLIAAPALASLITLSCLQLLGVPITIFHVLALLLVLGIGLDTSIFLYDSNNNAHTWLAVTLSSMTTLLAFGLLTLSATPVLHFFGQTVLIGIISVWFIAPVFSRRISQPLSEPSRHGAG